MGIYNLMEKIKEAMDIERHFIVFLEVINYHKIVVLSFLFYFDSFTVLKVFDISRIDFLGD